MDTIAFYIQLQELFPYFNDDIESKITTASHDHSGFVRQAIVTQSERILSIILYPEDEVIGPEDAEFTLSGINFVFVFFSSRQNASES